MRNIIIKCLNIVGAILSYVYSPKITSALCSLRNRTYTGFIRHGFLRIGNSVFIWHPYILMGLKYISIGNGNVFERDIQLTARKIGADFPEIIIGNHCLIRRGSHITAVKSIVIGDGLLTGTNVFITDNSHGRTDYTTLCTPPGERAIVSKGSVKIGNNVWLGNNVCIMPGVSIGDGVVVGANSVVTHDIQPYSVVAGVPAKIIKCRTE